MIWKLLIAAGAAFFAAGIAQYARILTARKLPKWIVPAAAGLGILACQVYFEYTWFERMQTKLPEGSIVTEVRETPAFWRPWTFVIPMKMGFSVVDTHQLQLVEADGERIARFRLYVFEQAFVDHIEQTGYVLNCRSSILVPLNETDEPQPDNALKLDMQSKLYSVVCH